MYSRKLRSSAARALTAAAVMGLVVGVSAGAQASPRTAAQSAAPAASVPIYLNTHYSFSERAADLVSRMTLAATSGVPGASAAESTASVNGHYEYGAALTPLGTQLYRWIAPTEGSGQVTNASVNVTRDDATHTTLYEMALPWSDLASVQPTANDVFSFSLIVNDKDNAGRKGYLAWGHGIGDNKDVGGFNMAQLMPANAS